MLKKIGVKDYYLEQDEFIAEVAEKKAIYLHHTAGGYRPDYTVAWWEKDNEQNKLRRVGTAFVIGGNDPKDNTFDGRILRCFDEQYWAYHLGLNKSRDGVSSQLAKQLNIETVGIELCCYGPLEKIGSKFYYVASKNKKYEVPKEQVCELEEPWRGHKYFQHYSIEQLKACKRLIIYLSRKFNIPLPEVKYTTEWFEINKQALEGVGGLWTHCNVRMDKTDCYPSPRLMDMLNSLNKKQTKPKEKSKIVEEADKDTTTKEAPNNEHKQPEDEHKEIKDKPKENTDTPTNTDTPDLDIEDDPFFKDMDSDPFFEDTGDDFINGANDNFIEDTNSDFFEDTNSDFIDGADSNFIEDFNFDFIEDFDSSLLKDLDEFLLDKSDKLLISEYEDYTKERL